jgi:hypothetical protein
MAAPISEDRKLAAEVRRLTLGKIKKLLEAEEAVLSIRELALHDRILEKLAGAVLPRLNEVTGADGRDLIPVPILANVQPHNSHEADSQPQEAD